MIAFGSGPIVPMKPSGLELTFDRSGSEAMLSASQPDRRPVSPKIYHITHSDNLPSLIADGYLWSDAESLRRGTVRTTIGMSEIKRRRLEELEVGCCPGAKVGQFVPFYFCPRSIMLYILYRGDAPGLHYTGGQRPIVHMEADLREAVTWANAHGRMWAFSTSNAGAYYTDFYNDLGKLDRIDWEAVHATNWQQRKEGKQAEYLSYQSFPWYLIRRIGVMDATVAKQVRGHLTGATHIPEVTVIPEWYY
ncbi:MAG: DUF4433 domain-containing protein [Capsulimonadales bacterium]|nr:DUF4433 domain-containing protein [Capsulimonadales bacterium]